MTATIDEALRGARLRLTKTSDTPDLDARRLLEHVLDATSSWLIAHGRHALETDTIVRFEALLARRSAGEPVAYLIGRAGFWTLDLIVNANVLIPRPDTETIVEVALQRLARRPLTVADLGTGSGAIALALASEQPHWQIWATDADANALGCAFANAERLGLANVHFVHGDWLAPLADQRFDAILSNPPYVAPDDAHLAAPELGYEPRGALVADAQGLADLGRIAAAAPAHLNPGGWLMLEHGADQGEAVRRLLRDSGFQTVETVHDLGDRPRVTLGCIPV